MLLVVADTGPIRYLIEIGNISILPQLFGKVLIPSVVLDELQHSFAPASVRAWANSTPAWLEVRSVISIDEPAFQSLDEGEKAALSLGMILGADLVLIDDRKGAAAARKMGFEVAGTLGLLTRASQRGLIDITQAINRLKNTNFHYRQEMLDELLRKYAREAPG